MPAVEALPTRVYVDRSEILRNSSVSTPPSIRLAGVRLLPSVQACDSGSFLLRHLLRTRRFHECGGRPCGQCRSVDALNAGNEYLSFTNDVSSFIAHVPPKLAVANVGTLSSSDSSGTFGIYR